MVRTQLYDHIK